jgi:hypothetical protein
VSSEPGTGHKQLQGSEAFMWAQLAQHWDTVADQLVAKEKAAAKVPPNGGEVNQG